MGEQMTNTSGAPADDNALRELAINLLSFQVHGSHGQSRSEPQLLVGAFPPDLPIELPMPEGSRLLGSFTLEEPIIALDTALTDEQVIAFYQDRLTAAGWQMQDVFGPRHGGFVHSSPNERGFANFFAPDGRFTLSLTTMPATSQGTHVELTLRNGVERFRPSPPQGIDMWDVLPLVRPPRHARQQSLGGGGGPDYVDTRAALETDLDLSTVAAHYLAELERGGWRRVDAGVSGRAAWSVWSFNDKEGAEWDGILLIIQRPRATGKYALSLQVQPENPEEVRGRQGGATSYGGVSYGRTVALQSHTILSGPMPAPPPSPEKSG